MKYKHARGWENAHQAPEFNKLSAEMSGAMTDLATTCASSIFSTILQSGEFCEDRPDTDPVAWCLTAQAFEKSTQFATAAQPVTPHACTVFEDEVMSRRNQRRMHTLLQDPTAENFTLPVMSNLLETMAEITQQCANPQYTKIIQTGCGENPQQDARAWCSAASQAPAAIRNRLIRSRPDWETIAEEPYDDEDELSDRDGWASVEGPTSFTEILSFDRMMYVELADFTSEEQKIMFTSLDIAASDFKHYGDAQEIIEEFRQAIERGADCWSKLPRASADVKADYGPALAANQITAQWHPEAAVIDTWYSRGNWKIHRNNLGIIQRRTLPGYVMFKLPEDPYCQVRSFTLTEQYRGGDSFQKARGVRFGYVRFQDCERR